MRARAERIEALQGKASKAAEDEKHALTLDIIRQIALSGCRRTEMIKLMWTEADTDSSCLRLADNEAVRSPRVDFTHY